MIQGLSLGTVIRMLRIEGDPEAEREERLARIEAANAALVAIDRLAETPSMPREELDRLRVLYVTRLQQWSGDPHASDDPSNADFADAVRLATVAEERRVVLDLRHRHVIGDDALRTIQGELDLIESAVKRRRPTYSAATWRELAARFASERQPGPGA